MMNVKALRIGNIVGFKNRTDFYAEILCLTTNGVEIERYFTDDDSDVQSENISDLTPILIDRNWLIKFGFQSGYGSGSTNWKFNMNFKHNLYTVKSMGSYDDIGFFKNGNFLSLIKGVHHLQNLMYDHEEYEADLIAR
jgi:hypothetical protein